MSNKKPGILFIDPNRVNRELFVNLLYGTSIGTQSLRIAPNIYEAVESQHEKASDIIFCGLFYKEDHDDEDLHAIAYQFPEIPVVLLANKDKEYLATREMAKGGSEYYVLESLTSEELEKLINQVILDPAPYKLAKREPTITVEKPKMAIEEPAPYLESLFDDSPSGMAIIDNQLKVLKANKAFKELTQYTVGEQLAQEMGLLLGANEMVSGLSQNLKDLEPVKIRRQLDGMEIDVLLTGYGIKNDLKVMEIFQLDRDGEERLDMPSPVTPRPATDILFEGVPEAIILLDDTDFEVRKTNEAASRFLAYNTGTWPLNFIQKVFIEPRKVTQAVSNDLVSNRFYDAGLQYLRRQDGSVTQGVLHIAPGGIQYPNHILLRIRDSSASAGTERKIAELSVRNTAITNALLDAYYLFDSGYKLIDLNSAAIASMHQSREEVVGRELQDLKPHFSNESRTDVFRYVMRTGKSQYLEQTIMLSDKDSLTHRMEIFKVGEGLGVIVKDITDERTIEKELLESEKRFLQLFHSAPISFSLLDIQNRKFLDVNDQFLRVTGFTREDVIGRDPIELGMLSDIDHLEIAINDIRKDNPIHNIEYKIFDKSGRRRDILSSFVIADRDGLPCLLIISNDISDRKRTEKVIQESENRYKGLFEESPVALLELDLSDLKSTIDRVQKRGEDLIDYFTQSKEALRQGMEGIRFMDVNQATLGMFGANTKKEVIKGSANILNETAFATLIKTASEITDKSRKVQLETTLQTLNNREIHVNLSLLIAPGHERNWDKAFLSIADISEIKEVEKKLTIKNKELDQFVYQAGHDLKAPLASLKGLVGAAQATLSDKDSLDYFDLVDKSVDRMNGILSDLLEITKLSVGEIRYEVIDFQRMIKDVLETIQNAPGRDKVNIRKEVKLSKEFKSDPKILYTVFQNLIENGVKYRDTEKDKNKVSIKIYDEENMLYIKVEDNGLGIDADVSDKVFDMFYRANASISGTGLGLYIVKNTVEKLGGTISVETEERKGSTFTVEIPYPEL